MPSYMTVEELAEMRRTTPAAIYNERHRGEGPPAIRSGRKLLFDEADVLRWLEDRKSSPAAA